MDARGLLAWAAWLLAVPLLALSAQLWAAPQTPLLRADTPRVSLEGYLEHFSSAEPLPFATARTHGYQRLPDFRSLGYGNDEQWFRVKAGLAPDAPPRWVFVIDSPELEEVDVWIEKPDGDFESYALGYYRPYENRPLQSRMFAMPFNALPDGTWIYFRVRTYNAIIARAEIWQPGALGAYETRNNFYRGLYFGALLIAVILYALLGAWLRDVPMAAYSGYVASQVLFHLGTNGYFPVMLGNHAGWAADALPRIGWLGGAVSIVLMWDYLLGLKRHYPRIHRLFLFTGFLNLGLLPFALMPFLVTAWILVVVKLANYLNSLNFFLGMAVALLFWRRSRRVELLLYFIAFLIPAVGTLINTGVNQGWVSQNVLTSNLYQISPLAHVLVMSCGLALRLRQVQKGKAAAEQEAAVTARRAEEQRRFVAMLSHEFRNPLAAIDRAAQMLQIKLRGLPPPEAQRLEQIRAHAATLSGFVDNFLITESLDYGGLALSRESCRVRSLVESVIRQQAEADRPRIRARVSPEDAGFNMDATLIGVALGNLLANALRYSPAGSPVEVQAVLDEAGLRLRVSDYGPGLDEAALEKLGTPYFRAGTSLGKKGSGLGYHFTQRIVQAHGGGLRAHSGAGRGLVVEISLPPEAGAA